MKNVVFFVKRLLLFLVTGSTALVIAACYGVPVSMQNIKLWFLKVRDAGDRPVRGLKVALLNAGQPGAQDTVEVVYTDSMGQAILSYNDPDGGPYLARDGIFVAHLSDVDSTENGGPYRDTAVALPARNDSDIVVTVELR